MWYPDAGQKQRQGLEDVTMHCVTRQLTKAQLSAAVKVQLGFQSQPLPKRPFMTAFSKINDQTNIVGEKLGTLQNSIWLRNLWPFFLVLYQGTLGLLLMSLKWHQSKSSMKSRTVVSQPMVALLCSCLVQSFIGNSTGKVCFVKYVILSRYKF